MDKMHMLILASTDLITCMITLARAARIHQIMILIDWFLEASSIINLRLSDFCSPLDVTALNNLSSMKKLVRSERHKSMNQPPTKLRTKPMSLNHRSA